MWILRSFVQFKEVKGLQDCPKTLKMGIENVKTPHYTVS